MDTKPYINQQNKKFQKSVILGANLGNKYI